MASVSIDEHLASSNLLIQGVWPVGTCSRQGNDLSDGLGKAPVCQCYKPDISGAKDNHLLSDDIEQEAKRIYRNISRKRPWALNPSTLTSGGGPPSEKD